MKPLKQLLQKQPTSLRYYKERYKSTIIHTTNTNIQWTTHPKKKTIIVVPIKASMLLLTITHKKKHHYLLPCVMLLLLLLSYRNNHCHNKCNHTTVQQTSSQQMCLIGIEHITPLHHNEPDHFCNKRNGDERNRIASHTNVDRNKQHLTATNRTAIIAITSYRTISHCIGRQQTTKNHTGPEQTKL